EDGIRDFHVTGVQTCALPISRTAAVERRILVEQVVHAYADRVTIRKAHAARQVDVAAAAQFRVGRQSARRGAEERQVLIAVLSEIERASCSAVDYVWVWAERV